jgi:F-type H+-transporting ATPase subunit delta
MIERTIARRYARALLDVSVTERRVRETEDEIRAVADLYRTAPSFRTALVTPVIPRPEKQAIAAKALEGRVGGSLVRFMQVLVEEGRASFLPAIAEIYDALADAHEGLLRVEVRTARPLPTAHRDRLRAALLALAGGRQVELQERVDAALIGGIALRIGDTVIDGSVADRLKRLKEHLMRGM